jgi:hypothetical protein
MRWTPRYAPHVADTISLSGDAAAQSAIPVAYGFFNHAFRELDR